MSHRLPFSIRAQPFWISICLGLGTFAVYWAVCHCDFVEFDDGLYAAGNPHVQAGLVRDSVRWAFQTTDGGNWHPITWLSLMLDSQLFNPGAGVHHFTNLCFHVCNTLLLFGVLTGTTRAIWRSALVAALFALHPLHVESVAWVAERKDVLSTFFFLLTLLAYTSFAQGYGRPSPEAATAPAPRPMHRSWPAYGMALALFILGLMSKPMLVTLPFVLLLLDYWPLKRFAPSDGRSALQVWAGRLVEKLPFFLLSAAACGVTLWTQTKEGAVSSLTLVPFGLRVTNAIVAYGRYLGKMCWPESLAVFYPQPSAGWPTGMILGAAALLLVITLLVFCVRRRQRYLLVGWLWYLGTLLPVIGLVQVGGQSMADRYTYIPLIGVFVMLAWGLGEMANQRPLFKTAISCFAALAVLACGGMTQHQIQHWQDSETLFMQAIRVTEDNYVAHGNLGLYFANQGRVDEATAHYHTALQIQPSCEEVHNNLGKILAEQGRTEEAQFHYGEALRLDPHFAQAHNNLALLLENQDRFAEAIDHFLQAQRARPDFAEPRSNLGALYMKQGRIDEAMIQFQAALRCNPRSPDVHYNLGLGFGKCGDLREAAVHFAAALRLRPNHAKAHYGLGTVLAQQQQTRLAIAQFEQALRLGFEAADVQEQLGNLWLQIGEAGRAVKCYREVLREKPTLLKSLNNLAWILATHPDANLRNGAEAVQLAERAAALPNRRQIQTLDTLAAAYAEAGRFTDAVVAARQAVELADAAGQRELKAMIQGRLSLYESGKPFRDSMAGGTTERTRPDAPAPAKAAALENP